MVRTAHLSVEQPVCLWNSLPYCVSRLCFSPIAVGSGVISLRLDLADVILADDLKCPVNKLLLW